MLFTFGIIAGIICGLLLSIIALVIIFRFQQPLKRNIERLKSATSQKGAILEPMDDNFLDNLLKK